MAYIYSTPLQKSDRTNRGIYRIYGLDEKTLQKLLYRIGKAPRSRIMDCTGEDIEKITTYLRARGEFDSFLRLKRKENILRLQAIKSYRGFRHRQQLPTRGQRTHTNAQTIRRFVFGQNGSKAFFQKKTAPDERKRDGKKKDGKKKPLGGKKKNKKK